MPKEGRTLGESDLSSWRLAAVGPQKSPQVLPYRGSEPVISFNPREIVSCEAVSKWDLKEYVKSHTGRDLLLKAVQMEVFHFPRSVCP